MKHTLRGDIATHKVWLDGEPLRIRPSWRFHKHSREFNWGYGGSGPSQLALAIVLKLTNKSSGYQDFKWSVIGRLPVNHSFDVVFDFDFEDMKLISLHLIN